MMTKQEIRDYITAQKIKLTDEQVKNYSDILTRKFITHEAFLNCSVLYSYISFNQEVLTNGIIEHAWKSGKKVAVPKTYKKPNMDFCYIESFDELELSNYGIPEPPAHHVADDENILILMPGLAFDRNFNRVGYGGGYYDKYLSDHKNKTFTKVALGFDFQLVPYIESDEHDIKLDIIITPSNIIQ
jgi:5-formyltetrahydrofolate cyclo-ligase